MCFLFIMTALYGCSKEKESPRGTASPNTITVSGAWALYPLVVTWAEEYQKKNPGVIVDVSAGGTGKGMADALSGAADLAMASRDITKAETAQGAWFISVAKDAVVPMMSDANPLKEALLKRGITRKEFASIWISGTLISWDALAKSERKYPLHAYTRSDACGASETWAKYVGGTQEDLKGICVYGDPGLAEAVRKDPLGIGYNNVNFAYDAITKKTIRGLLPVPVDINGSGNIEPDENFYNDRDALVKAIADNKYPSPPARTLHLAARGMPQKQQVRDFLLWILGDGQRYVSESGYICLPGESLKKQAEVLTKKP